MTTKLLVKTLELESVKTALKPIYTKEQISLAHHTREKVQAALSWKIKGVQVAFFCISIGLMAVYLAAPKETNAPEMLLADGLEQIMESLFYVAMVGFVFMVSIIAGHQSSLMFKEQEIKKAYNEKFEGPVPYIDPVKADSIERSLKQAPEEIESKSLHEIAAALIKGDYFKKDESIGWSLMAIAGEMGDANASYKMAHAFKNGQIECHDNYVKPMDQYLMWLKMAEQQNSYDAMQELSTMKTQNSGASGVSTGVAVIAVGMLLGIML